MKVNSQHRSRKKTPAKHNGRSWFILLNLKHGVPETVFKS
jgi:hypothetical protein